MRKLFLGISALALICIAGLVAAQASRQDQAPPSSDQTAAEATAKTASQPDQGTQMRLARMDTSAAAFRKLDVDNDGRISALEAADNPRVAAAFTMADKDKDGYLSKEEFEAMGTGNAHPSDDASSPSGDRATQPSGDQRATAPNEPSSTSSTPPRATPRQKR